MAGAGPSGYRLIIGVLALIVVIFLWIPLGYVFGEVATALNTGITDTGAISRNDIMVQAFYYTLFVIVIAVIIYIVKPTAGETEQGEVVYAPAYY